MRSADGMAAESPDQPILDQAALGAIRSLGHAGGISALAKVIGLYLEHSPVLVGEIETAIANRNAAALCQAAHSLKSSSASLGAQRFAMQCKDLETIGRNGTTDGADAILGTFRAQYALVRDALEAERERNAEAV